MFAFNSIRQIFGLAHYPAHHVVKPRLPTSTLLTESTLATAERHVCAPTAAGVSLSSGEDKAFDILFAIYHYHYLESEQVYQDWRCPTKRVDPSTVVPRDALQHGQIQPECGIHPESEGDISSPSTFLGFDSDSDSSSLVSNLSEDFLEDISLATSDFAQTNSTGPRTVYVAPAIPPHISVLCRKECGMSSDNLDVYENRDPRYLTPRARKEADRRSKNIQKLARAVTRELEGTAPLKAHEHSAPRSRRSPATLKDLGCSSRLRTCWTMEDVEQEIQEDAMSAQLSGKR